jgi:predicted aspartyl protease
MFSALTAMLALAGPALPGALVVDVPLVETAAGPGVRVRVGGGAPALFLLDVGTNLTLVHDGLARRLGLAGRATLPLVTLTGSQTVPWTRIDELDVGGAVLRDVEALLAPIQGVRAAAPEIQGVLGQMALAQHAFVLDNTRRRLLLGQRLDGACVPVTLREGRLTVGVRVGSDGRPASLLLDSGASHLVLFGSAAAQVAPAQRRSLETNQGQRSVQVGRLGRLGVGTLELRGLETILIEDAEGRMEDGLLPTRLFARVGVDPGAGCAVFTAN